MSQPLAQLSCAQCARRKTKCSKNVPCSACVKAGIDCTSVQRHRLPRGRSGNKRASSAGLRDRVENLESIIARLQSNRPISVQNYSILHDTANIIDGQSNELVDTRHESATAKLPATGEFVASSFWSELSEAVADLKDVLDSPDSVESTTATIDSSEADPLADIGGHAVIFPSVAVRTCKYETHLRASRTWLVETYRQRVDPIFKLLHWPSTYQSMHPASFYEDGFTPSIKALRSAVCFAAACTLLDKEVADRQELVRTLCQSTEAQLAAADLLTTTSLETLQAFVIYLLGLRTYRANATQWTLTAMAIRIAHAQGIPARLEDRTSNSSQDLLEAELHRRLWTCIGVLDVQSAFDRGTKPLIPSDELQCFPANINDEDINPTMALANDREDSQYTEMTHLRTIHRAGLTLRRLTEIGSSAILTLAGWQEQVAILENFENYAKQLEESAGLYTPMQRYTLTVAKGSLVTMRLLLYRPLHKRGQGYRPPVDKFDVLGTATEVLESSQMKLTSGEFARFAWFAWPKWYALAVVLAELCSAQGPKAEHAWSVAQRSYEDHARMVADTKAGLLWRPIMKIMHKVKSIREQAATCKSKSDLDERAATKDTTITSIHSDPVIVDLEATSWMDWDLLTDDIMNSNYHDIDSLLWDGTSLC